MYNEQIENLVKAALADGMLTEKEKQILFKKAQSMGIDLDEFEMVLDARLVELQKAEKEKAEKSAPKSSKYGDVRKCPACGAMVPALVGSCPECGYEFSGVDANLSSKKLAELLLQEKSEYKQAMIVETFPIPNTKSDLMEFLTSLKPRIHGDDKLSKAYFKKYSECVEKSKVLFANDKIFITHINEYKNINRNRKIKLYGKWLIILIILLGSIIFLNKSCSNPRKERDKCLSKIEKLVSKDASKENVLEVLNQAIKFNKLHYDKKGKYKYKSVDLSIVKLMLEHGYIDEAIIFYKEIVNNAGYGVWSPYDYDENRYVAKQLWNKLLELERFDEAWEYYKWESGSGDYDYLECRYNFTIDCLNVYLKQNNKDKARELLKEQLKWFIKKIDLSDDKEFVKWDKNGNPIKSDYRRNVSPYRSTEVKAKLTKYIDEY